MLWKDTCSQFYLWFLITLMVGRLGLRLKMSKYFYLIFAVLCTIFYDIEQVLQYHWAFILAVVAGHLLIFDEVLPIIVICCQCGNISGLMQEEMAFQGI